MNDIFGRVLFFFVVCLLLYYIGSTLHDMGRDKALDAAAKENMRKLREQEQAAFYLELKRREREARDAENRQTDAIEALITHAQKLAAELSFTQSCLTYMTNCVKEDTARLMALETLVSRAERRVTFCEERLAGKAAP